MRTWFDYETQKWVDKKPERYFVNLTCIKTGEKIFTEDTISIIKYNNNIRSITKIHDHYPFIVTFEKWHQENWKPILIKH